MNSETPAESPAPKGRPGRKPLGDGPMTDAERKRRSRELFAEHGGHQFAVRVSGPVWDQVEIAAQAFGREPRELVRALFDTALQRFMNVNGHALALRGVGVPLDELREFYKKNLFDPSPRTDMPLTVGTDLPSPPASTG
jgi:hypothetical protein